MNKWYNSNSFYTDKDYVILQNYPNKVIFSKPDIELLDKYMSENDYEYIEKDTIQFSINKYYLKWEWK